MRHRQSAREPRTGAGELRADLLGEGSIVVTVKERDGTMRFELLPQAA